jgi:hypothetical protein
MDSMASGGFKCLFFILAIEFLAYYYPSFHIISNQQMKSRVCLTSINKIECVSNMISNVPVKMILTNKTKRGNLILMLSTKYVTCDYYYIVFLLFFYYFHEIITTCFSSSRSVTSDSPAETNLCVHESFNHTWIHIVSIRNFPSFVYLLESRPTVNVMIHEPGNFE